MFYVLAGNLPYVFEKYLPSCDMNRMHSLLVNKLSSFFTSLNPLQVVQLSTFRNVTCFLEIIELEVFSPMTSLTVKTFIFLSQSLSSFVLRSFPLQSPWLPSRRSSHGSSDSLPRSSLSHSSMVTFPFLQCTFESILFVDQFLVFKHQCFIKKDEKEK